MSAGTKKAPAEGALCARSVASADLHQHSPLRLTQYTSSPYGDYLRVLALPCYHNYSKTEHQPQQLYEGTKDVFRQSPYQ